jgi:ribosomal protein S18 acetylase RimI-like enzyme
MKSHLIRLATKNDLGYILEIVEDARSLARSINSTQWLGKDGYPSRFTFEQDIADKQLYVLQVDGKIAAMVVISENAEPTYIKIYKGEWLLNHKPYLVIHRLAVRKEFYKQGLAKSLLIYAEEVARKEGFASIRIDTSKQNKPMLSLVDKLNYKYCGIIKLNKYIGEEDNRLAFEKVI